MPSPSFKLQVRANEPNKQFVLIYRGVKAIVERNSAWELLHDSTIKRLGMSTLHWTTALRRAVEQLEGNGK